MEPEDTEVWEPIPPHVSPDGFIDKAPPSDAVVLFDGSDMNSWKPVEDTADEWKIEDDVMTVVPGTGDLQTRQKFGSVQLHLEWRTPEQIEGEGQDRGNSGVFFQSHYELQILDSYENDTYANGVAGSIYKQRIPRVNAARKPGRWQSFDVTFIAPVFGDDGEVKSAARMTVLWNGIMVHHSVELKGFTRQTGHPQYEAHSDRLPIMLQDHGSPVSFRNIWVRELTRTPHEDS